MELLNEYLTATEALALGYCAAAFVQALPKPTRKCGMFYEFLYKLAHLFAANLKLVNKPVKRGAE